MLAEPPQFHAAMLGPEDVAAIRAAMGAQPGVQAERDLTAGKERVPIFAVNTVDRAVFSGTDATNLLPHSAAAAAACAHMGMHVGVHLLLFVRASNKVAWRRQTRQTRNCQ